MIHWKGRELDPVSFLTSGSWNKRDGDCGVCRVWEWSGRPAWGEDLSPVSFDSAYPGWGPRITFTRSPDDAWDARLSVLSWEQYSKQGGLWVKILALYPVSDFLSKGSLFQKKKENYSNLHMFASQKICKCYLPNRLGESNNISTEADGYKILKNIIPFLLSLSVPEGGERHPDGERPPSTGSIF